MRAKRSNPINEIATAPVEPRNDNSSPRNSLALYVHIPFCEKRCGYCAFSVLPVGNNKNFLAAQEKLYIEALKWELEFHISSLRPTTSRLAISSLYFGGGTPSILSIDALSEIISAIRAHFPLTIPYPPRGEGNIKIPSPSGRGQGEGDNEWTIEAHPATFIGSQAQEKFEGLKSLGFNRISFGVESFNPETLLKLHRDYAFEDIATIVQNCREAGLSNINFDLICGWPWEGKKDFSRSLELAISLNPQHISLYPLQIEEETFFERAGFVTDYDRQADEYLEAHEYLTSQGFNHYEIANFAKPGFESRHNLAYWRYDDYLGVGLGAASKIGKKTWTNIRKYPSYVRAFERRLPLIEESQTLSDEELHRRQIILGLRLKEGVSTLKLEQILADTALSDFKNSGLLCQQNGNSYLTPAGWLVSNQLFTAAL